MTKDPTFATYVHMITCVPKVLIVTLWACVPNQMYLLSFSQWFEVQDQMENKSMPNVE